MPTFFTLGYTRIHLALSRVLLGMLCLLTMVLRTAVDSWRRAVNLSSDKSGNATATHNTNVAFLNMQLSFLLLLVVKHLSVELAVLTCSQSSWFEPIFRCQVL